MPTRSLFLLVALLSTLSCKKKEAPPPHDATPESLAREQAAPAAPRPPAPALLDPAHPPAPAPAPDVQLVAPVDIGLPKTLKAGSGDLVARTVWQNLDKLKNACPDSTQVGDYPGGGHRTLGCALFSVVPMDVLGALANKPIFLGQIHNGEGGLELKDRTGFGRYNPEFVEWAANALVPGAADAQFREATQPLYDKFIRPVARIFLITHDELSRDSGRRSFERKLLRDALEHPRPDLEPGVSDTYGMLQRSPFATDEATKDWLGDELVNASAAAFWVRRSIDGTEAHFARGLSKLMTAYDSAFLGKVTAIRVANTKPTWSDRQADRYVRWAWEHLSSTKNVCDWEYPMGESGIRTIWCWLEPLITDLRTGRLAGLAPFVSGPGPTSVLEDTMDQRPDFKSRYDFGHYNPAFVKWLVEHAVPGESDQLLKKATQGSFEANLRLAARSYWVTWARFSEAPDVLAKKVEQYKARLADKTLSPSWHEEQGDLLVGSPAGKRATDAGYEASAGHVGQAAAFWVRRTIDGTAPEFARGLEKLMKTYDPAFAIALKAAAAKEP